MKTAFLLHLKVKVQHLLKKHHDVFFSTMYKKIKFIFFKNMQCLFFNQLSAFTVHSEVLSYSFCQHCEDILLHKISMFFLHYILLNKLLSILSVMFSKILKYISFLFTLIIHLLHCLNEL